MSSTVPALLASGASRFADHPAIVDERVSLTYGELAAAVERVSAAYLAAGLEPGDRAAIWMPNRHEFVLALLGAENIGISVVLLNTRFRGGEARVIMERSRARALVVDNGFLDTDYLDMIDPSGLEHLTTVVNVGSLPHAAAQSWEDFLAAGEAVPAERVAEAAAQVEPDTICDILYTSGTTGVPKGVMSAHRQTLGVAGAWARGAELDMNDKYAIVNPLFHTFGYKAGVFAAMTAGSTVHLVPTFDPVGLMELVERERITVLPGAPTIFITLLNHPRLKDFDLSSLRFSIAGAASVPETLHEEMLEVIGFDTVAQAYGLTECVVATRSRPNEDPRHIAETTGPPIEGVQVRVVDAEGNDVPVGTDGEIWLHGEYVMVGYFEDPEATAAAIDTDGWLHTGDVGRLDEHGCLKITDRIKDMFTVGGFNVYPAEIENVLSRHPAVMESAVIGIDDERMGMVGRAYVLPRPGSTITPDELTAYCREHLANFKVPREFVIADELPRNAMGKVLKKDLRTS